MAIPLNYEVLLCVFMCIPVQCPVPYTSIVNALLFFVLFSFLAVTDQTQPVLSLKHSSKPRERNAHVPCRNTQISRFECVNLMYRLYFLYLWLRSMWCKSTRFRKSFGVFLKCTVWMWTLTQHTFHWKPWTSHSLKT